MALSRRLMPAIAAVIIFSITSFSYSGSVEGASDHSDDMNGSFLIASTTHNKYSIENEKKEIEVSVQMDEDSCDQVTCMDIYPKDGKIEGRPVSEMTPSGINNRGQVVGRCMLEDSDDPYPFFREPDGNVWIFKTPSISGRGEFTDINDSGAAVGFYQKDKSHTEIGFLMTPDREWATDIQYPENSCPNEKNYLHTQPNGINVKGEIVGNIGCTARPGDDAQTLFKGEGFYRSSDGTFYKVQYKDAVRTVAGKISDTGVIVGYYVVDNDVWIPFAALKDEVIQPVNRSESSAR